MNREFSSNALPFLQLISYIIYSALEVARKPDSLLYFLTNMLPVLTGSSSFKAFLLLAVKDEDILQKVNPKIYFRK